MQHLSQKIWTQVWIVRASGTQPRDGQMMVYYERYHCNLPHEERQVNVSRGYKPKFDMQLITL